MTLAAAAGIVATLVVVIAVAVYSPLMALRTVEVNGSSRIDAADIRSAIADQMGTPLALVNEQTIGDDLAAFPLIRDYSTEIVPPDTLRIDITERSPLGSVAKGSLYELVDPAGIVLQQSPGRIPGVPLMVPPDGKTSGTAFSSIVAVLLSLPPELREQLDTITATTKDDVSFILTGVGQRVQWGSAEESDKKAALLAALIRLTDPEQPGVFDVSAPTNGVFRKE